MRNAACGMGLANVPHAVHCLESDSLTLGYWNWKFGIYGKQ